MAKETVEGARSVTAIAADLRKALEGGKVVGNCSMRGKSALAKLNDLLVEALEHVPGWMVGPLRQHLKRASDPSYKKLLHIDPRTKKPVFETVEHFDPAGEYLVRVALERHQDASEVKTSLRHVVEKLEELAAAAS